jgi:uncharacterized integral membrane protein
MWFARWKSASGVEQLPPERMSTAVAVQIPPQAHVEEGREPETASAAGGKSSLWRSASIGLLFSAFIIILQVGNGQGFELASSAHTASLATIIALFIRVLTAPLIFVLVAVARNLVNRRQKKSSASALLGALTFAMLFALILGGLVVYGAVFFSSEEAISGESRKAFVADNFHLCVQKQRSLFQDVTEAEINQYCSCVGKKMADGTTYRQLELHASAPANLKRAEAAGLACALAGN